jgi:predicted RNA-binding Zn-ribbon protein involved in translation (DUF1610 family)
VFLPTLLRKRTLLPRPCTAQPSTSLRVALSEQAKRQGPSARGANVSDLKRSTRSQKHFPCPRCATGMEDILTIPPAAGEMGLMAYECPKCGYVTSVLLQPDEAQSPPRRGTV